MSAENSPSANPSSNPNKVYLALGGCGLLIAGLALGFALDRPSPPPFHQPPHVRAGFPNSEKPGHKMGPNAGGEREMGRRHAMQGGRREQADERREQRGEMREEIQKWAEPMVKIREKYRGEIAKVLRPEQKAKMESSLENRQEHREEGRGARGPGGPGGLMGVVLIAPQLDRITQHLVLDDAQKKQVEAVLKKQREEILAWLDANPAPKPPGRPDRALGHREPDMAEGFAAHRPFPPGPPHRP